MQDTIDAPSASPLVSKQHEPARIEKGNLATRRAFLQAASLRDAAPGVHGFAYGAAPVPSRMAR